MSDEIPQTQKNQTASEQEIVIDLDKTDDSTTNQNLDNNAVVTVAPKNQNKTNKTKFVDKKRIPDLSSDERDIILNNYRNGIDQPYYDVKLFKNGSTRIIKKKTADPTTSQRVINSSKQIDSTPAAIDSNQKTYYTDNQLLFEHIIELNSKIDKLMIKHKKLKKKYNQIQNDLYLSDDDVVEQTDINNNDVIDNKQTDDVDRESGDKIELTDSIQTNSYVKPMQSNIRSNIRSNWRSRLSYL